MCVCVSVSVCVCVSVFECVRVHLCECMYVCVSVRVCTCVKCYCHYYCGLYSPVVFSVPSAATMITGKIGIIRTKTL